MVHAKYFIEVSLWLGFHFAGLAPRPSRPCTGKLEVSLLAWSLGVDHRVGGLPNRINASLFTL